jgi:hypothetical protein
MLRMNIVHLKKDNQLTDEKIHIMEKIIDQKREMLFEKKKNMEKMCQENAFLNQVRNDYKNYFVYIANQKKDQIAALNDLNNYIIKLNESGTLSEQNQIDTTFEQKKILKEIESIKIKLDDMIKN